MTEREYKIILALIIFLFLDLVRPFGYLIPVEFLFLGIIYLSLNYRLGFSFMSGVIFGYLKDCLSLSGVPVSIIEFSLIVLMTNYFLSHFSYRFPSEFFVFPLIIFHIILNNAYVVFVPFDFSIFFFVYSSAGFSLINYLLKKWKLTSLGKYI